MIIHNILINIFLAICLSGCGGGSGGTTPAAVTPVVPVNVSQKGNRILSIDLSEAEDADYDAAFATATSTGMQATGLPLNWSDLETAVGVYDNTYLAIANSYYPPKNIAISLSLRTINTNKKEVPTDLSTKGFDDPEMIDRFKKLLDFVFSEIPNLELNSLSIGNEIDAYLGMDKIKWAQYRTFYEAVSAYARSKRANLKIGAKATYAGITGTMSDEHIALNKFSDIIMTTYYPLNSDFTVKQPGVISNEFKTLIDLYPAKPIYFMELGYPSGALCNSSETLQGDFISEVFTSWDKYKDRIQFISFTWLNDIAPSAVQDLISYYGYSDPIFYEYLATLGLRTYTGSGVDKKAFAQLKAEAKQRGW